MSLLTIVKNFLISLELLEKSIKLETLISSRFFNSVLSTNYWISSILIILISFISKILKVELSTEYIINSTSILPITFSSFKSNISNKNLILSSDFEFEKTTNPENNSNASINPFLSVSHIWKD